jgi:hypothetical protein
VQTDTVTPSEAALLGQLRGITEQWTRYQPIVEQLCDEAMRQRHINLLLLQLGLIAEYPQGPPPPPEAVQNSGMVDSLLKSRSLKRARSMSMQSFAASLVPTAVKQESEELDLDAHLPVVSFITLLKKAANTEESRTMVEAMWTMAIEEKRLINRLERLSNSWDELFFLFNSRRVFGIYPFTNLEGLMGILEEGKLALEEITQSPYLLGVRRRYEYVENLLAILQSRVEGIQSCQSLWLSLSRLMQRPEVQSAIPDELSELERAVSDWKMLGLNLQQAKTSLVMASTGLNPPLAAIPGLQTTLQRLQRHCAVLLGPIREDFPRLYFVDDHDLLQAIACIDSPTLLTKAFLTSVFPGVEALRCVPSPKHIEFEKESNVADIDAVVGLGGELMPLVVPVRVTFHSTLASVMKVLGEVLTTSVAEHTHRSLSACAIMKGAEWVSAFPLQSTLLVDSMVWTDRCAALFA